MGRRWECPVGCLLRFGRPAVSARRLRMLSEGWLVIGDRAWAGENAGAEDNWFNNDLPDFVGGRVFPRNLITQPAGLEV